MFAEYHPREMVTAAESKIRNALKFGTAGEVDSKEGLALAERLIVVPPNCSEVVAPQVELDGAVGRGPISKPPTQLPRMKLIFDVDIDDDFSD